MLIPLAAFFLSIFYQSADPTIPAGASAVVTVEGQGVQIYDCTERSGAYAWKFRAPEAKLLDPKTHEPLGTHGVGPTWTWKDGSSITGKVAQTLPSPEAGSIPWLLLKTQPAGTQTGKLSPVVWVRRSDTRGGSAPVSGCDATHAGSVSRVAYKAIYTFYTATVAGQS